jgi:hypothetical protein
MINNKNDKVQFFNSYHFEIKNKDEEEDELSSKCSIYNDSVIFEESHNKLHFFSIYQSWHMLINNPKLYLGINPNYCAMFGKHIAHFNFYGLSKKFFSLNTTNTSYNRFNAKGKIGKFHLNKFNYKTEEDKVYLGIVKSLWQSATDYWLDANFDITKVMIDDCLKLFNEESLLSNDKQQKFSFFVDQYSLEPNVLLDNVIIKKIKAFIYKYPDHVNSIHLNQLLKMFELIFASDLFSENISSVYYLEIKNCIKRLNFFLNVLVVLGFNYHLKFVVIFEQIIHELSLLVFFLVQQSKQPIISYDTLLTNTRQEFLLSNQNIKFLNNINVLILPANSGMHAHTISVIISQKLLNINEQNKELFAANIVGEFPHYFECDYIRSKIIEIKFNLNHSIKDSQIHFINNSFINMNYYIQPTNIEEYVQKLNENHHNILIIDRTCSLGDSLTLSYEIIKLINDNKLTVIIWESWQKFGLLGTDQVQYGRSVVIGSQLTIDKLDYLNLDLKNDMINLDYQIASLFQLTRNNSSYYKNICYKNAKKLRMILEIDNDQEGPFINNKELEFVLKFFGPVLMVKRNSFGFNYTTFIDNRISVGAEPNVEIELFGYALKIIKNKTSNDLDESINNILGYIKDYFNDLVFDIKLLSCYDKVLDLFVHMFVLRFLLICNKYKQKLDISLLNKEKVEQICGMILKMDKTSYRNLLELLDNSRDLIVIIVDVKKILKLFK